MSNPFIPLWILGGPFIGLLLLAFAFLGSSSMSERETLASDTL